MRAESHQWSVTVRLYMFHEIMRIYMTMFIRLCVVTILESTSQCHSERKF